MNITCPECQGCVEFTDVFNASFCWASGVVAFNCPSCGKPAYFAPGGQHIEVGMLGSASTLDPIPGVLYPAQVSILKQGQAATISWQGLSKQLPSAGAYIGSRQHAR